jgi:cytochrome P450
VADQSLKGIDAAAGFNVIDWSAFPLTIAVIWHRLGAPTEDHTKFRVWGHQVATTLDPQSDLTGQSRTRSASDVGATWIPKGTSIILSIGGANRDPDVLLEPGRLPIDRTDASRHGAFGFGLHHGLGTAVAGLDARIVTSRRPLTPDVRTDAGAASL